MADSIQQISRTDWIRLFGDGPEGYDFFRTLEESALEGFTFSYLTITVEERVELIAPLFSSDLDLAIGLEGGALKTAVEFLRKIAPRFLILRTLFCGSPFGESGSLGLTSESGRREDLIGEFARALNRFSREKKLPLIMFKDFDEESMDRLASLARNGFLRGDSFPNVILPLPFRSMDEYLATLSYSRRKGLRRKIRASVGEENIVVKVVSNIEGIVDEIYQLYLQTYHAATVRFEKLTPQFFIRLSRNLPAHVLYFLYYRNGRLICFNLCLRDKNTLIDKFIGMDYSVARELNLYFFTWYHNVEWCILNKFDHYQVGQTDYADKIALGGKFHALYYFARHTNPIINTPLKVIARFLSPRS